MHVADLTRAKNTCAGGNPHKQAMPLDALQLLASFDRQLSFTTAQGQAAGMVRSSVNSCMLTSEVVLSRVRLRLCLRCACC